MIKYYQRLMDRFCRNKIVIKTGWYNVAELERIGKDLINNRLVYRYWVPEKSMLISGKTFPLHISEKTCAFYYFNSFKKFTMFKLTYSGFLPFTVDTVRYNYVGLEIDGEIDRKALFP